MTIDTSSTDPLLFDIVALADEHRPKWRDLYRQYAHFYAVDITDAVLDRTWSWLIDDAHELHGYVARDQHNFLVGLAHYRAFPRPLLGRYATFLDDLFVHPPARNNAVGRALVQAVADIARQDNRPLVRWITASDNARARGLYDQIAEATHWVTYDMRLGGVQDSD